MIDVKIQTRIGTIKPDGIFGPNTLKATIATQRYIGVKPDGIVGPNTVAAFKRKFPNVSLDVSPRPIFRPDSTIDIIPGADNKSHTPEKKSMIPWVLGAVGIGLFLRSEKGKRKKGKRKK
jgi:peptidoglycan hydrolase-like protein with peptidoglycan-binding domain